MCGIAGVAGDQWADPRRTVGAMLGRLQHRGPDDEGMRELAGATLGVRRLAIIDVATGQQPIGNERETIVAVQNGEIYNFQHLRSELRRTGHRFRTDHSDTEVLPHLYEKHGAEFLSHLRGMFAIALWDTRTSTLLLARDRMGKKPLFYSANPEGIAFASEIEPLLGAGVSREVDSHAIREYLRLGYINAPRSAFTAIRRVRPGHVVTWNAGQLEEQRYWRLAFTPKLEIQSDADAIDGLRERLEQAVRLRLISDVPLGVFLSGGIDSSTVVALAAKVSPTPVKTYSVGFNESAFSELRYARAVAQRYGTDHHELLVEASASDVLPMLVRHLGEPFADSSIIPTYLVARAARQHVAVALNGDGGDELFAGYDRYRAAALALRLGSRSRLALAWAAKRVPTAAWLPLKVRRARRFGRVLELDHLDRYREWIEYFGDASPIPAIGDGRGGDWTDEPLAETGAEDPVERLLALDMRTYLPGDLLVKMDIASMAASLEGRSPFLDHVVVEYVARLPMRLKLRKGRSKYLLRRLAGPLLPAEILDRPKQGFSIPAGEWIRGPLRPLVSEALLQDPRNPYVDSNSVASLVKAHLDRRLEDPSRVWALLMLELWYRTFIDRSA